jgi:hypothetical protein
VPASYFADGNGTRRVRARIVDDDGGFTDYVTEFTINNVAPTLTLSGAASVDEAAAYTLNLSASDPGVDTIASWTINWGDGTQIVSGNPSSVMHTYGDGVNNYTISATATDEDGTHAAGNTVSVTVNNVAPTLTLSGAASVDEGSVYTLNLSSSDPGVDTITSWTINWGDGTQIVSGNPSSVMHTYGDGLNNYTISATATDEDGTHPAANTVAVTVNNVAPTLAISGATSVNEGSVYTLNLSSSDPGVDTITSWMIDWGDGVQIVSGNPSSVTHTYADGPNSYTVTASATDEDGTFAAGNTVAVTVNNVDPTINALSTSSPTIGGAHEDGEVTLAATFTDPGVGDAHTATIDWGDGATTAGVVTESMGSGSVAGSHAYVNGGIYTVTLTVADDDTGAAVATTTTVIAGAGRDAVTGVLEIVGTNGSDIVKVLKQTSSTIKVKFDLPGDPLVERTFNTSGPDSITAIEIYLGGGDDLGALASDVAIDAKIFGNDGNDKLVGGAGSDVLIGGDGLDVLYGRSGRDLLVGGQCIDALFGDSDGDIIVGGDTDLDVDLTTVAGVLAMSSQHADLDAIMTTWRSGSSYSDRVAAVSPLASAHFFDDNDLDLLSGGSGQDLFFVGDQGCLDDIALDQTFNELELELD